MTLLAAQILWGQGTKNTAVKELPLRNVFTTNIEATLDAVFNQAYPAHSPGATVLLAKADTILYRKAFGMANLELNVQMKPETVLQLASITKQFTSVAVLMLMEQGKLSLKDPLSKYIADFPRGNEITLHHLLNHTSGIKSYTNLPEFRTKTRLDMTPEEIIAVFKSQPLDFKPGERFAYSNSGYVLLGYIIEQLSGMSYNDFIQKIIFDRLGMKNSSYADTYKIIPNRANGYQLYEGNYENAEYMSTTVPYAAGSLMSTIDDMFRWNRAMHNNLLITERTKQLAFTNYRLNNGTYSNYGYGWYVNEIEGISTVEHPGGMNGFTTAGIYVPQKDIYAIVLSNRDDGVGAEMITLKAVATLLGKPITSDVAVSLKENDLKKWEGAYQFEDVVRFITLEKGVLYSKREGGRPKALVPLSANVYRLENSLATYKFSFKNGKRQVLYEERISKSIGVETDKKPFTEKEAIVLTPKILSRYTGVYELQPGFQIEITLKKDRLFAKASGQPEVELIAEADNRFFIREIGARIVFNQSPEGVVNSLTFSQGADKTEGKKIR
ncbi:serine hydrolase [Lacibacter cauensis]|nr:serine hydrolase [Lacibacter cauensis]